MSIALGTFRIQVDYVIDADEEMLDVERRDKQIEAALERYSKDRPDTSTEDVSGDGGRYYALESVLDSWSEGFSSVLKVEYPAATVASDELPVYLGPDDWQDDFWAEISGTQTRHLYLPNHAPAATETMRITYTIPYTFAGSPQACNVPAQDFYAVCNLAACLCCQALAVKYSSLGDTLLGIDSASHTSKAQEYAQRATELCRRYTEHMGLTVDGQGNVKPTPAGEFVDLDTSPGWPTGRDYVFHGRGTR